MRSLLSRTLPVALVAPASVALVWVAAVLLLTSRDGANGAAPPVVARNGHRQQRWPDGQLKSDATYRDDAYDGEVRTWYEDGRPYELRHYVNGHEEGVQQSWTDAGVLYLNYEVHDGRRYGLVNPTPCNIVGTAAIGANERAAASAVPTYGTVDSEEAFAERSLVRHSDSTGLPYYSDPTFVPHWSAVPHHVASFTLRTQTGAEISDRSLRGHPYVASFIYTQCAAVCPLVVQQLSRVQHAFARARVRIVSFSVTPDTDTPAALRQFGRDRGIDARTWSLVTGDKRTIYRLARESYFADDTRAGDSPDDETAFLHTEKLVLVDADGRLRGIYNGTQPHAVDQLIADLRQLGGH